MPLMPRADRRLYVAPDVVAELETTVLSRLYDEQEYSVTPCFVCGRSIAPEHEDQAQVVLLRDPARGLDIVNLSHARCMPSAIVRTGLPTLPETWVLNWAGVLRTHAVAAVIVWEM